MKILGTGLSGLVGSRVVELLKDKYGFENLSLETGVDITVKDEVEERIKRSDAKVVLHLAAKADVDGCEKDKEKDIKILRYKDIKRQKEEWRKEETAWAINVLGTRNVVEACHAHKKKIIYISTDFVFDGKNASYSEDDKPHPINWYGQTKYEGEKVVSDSGLPFIVARIAYPYRVNFSIKSDFVRSMIKRFKGGEVKAVTDHIMTPTFIDDIAYALGRLIESKVTGVYHVVGSQFISPYEVAVLVAIFFGFDRSLIKKTSRAVYFKGRAPRPFNLSLRNDKIEKLGVKMRTFEEGLEEIKRQIISLDDK